MDLKDILSRISEIAYLGEVNITSIENEHHESVGRNIVGGGLDIVYDLTSFIEISYEEGVDIGRWELGCTNFDKISKALSNSLVIASGLDAGVTQDMFLGRFVSYNTLMLQDGSRVTEARKDVYIHSDVSSIDNLSTCLGSVQLRSASITSLGSITKIQGILVVSYDSKLYDIGILEECSGVTIFNVNGDQVDLSLGQLKVLLKDIRDLPREDLPLYLNDDNIIVRNLAKHLLET